MFWMCNLFVFSNLGKKTDLSNDDGDALPNKQKEKNFLLAAEASVKQEKSSFQEKPQNQILKHQLELKRIAAPLVKNIYISSFYVLTPQTTHTIRSSSKNPR